MPSKLHLCTDRLPHNHPHLNPAMNREGRFQRGTKLRLALPNTREDEQSQRQTWLDQRRDTAGMCPTVYHSRFQTAAPHNR